MPQYLCIISCDHKNSSHRVEGREKSIGANDIGSINGPECVAELTYK